MNKEQNVNNHIQYLLKQQKTLPKFEWIYRYNGSCIGFIGKYIGPCGSTVGNVETQNRPSQKF